MQRVKDNSWQRLEAVIRWTGMSVNRFAHHIGLHRGETLYQIRRGNNGISKNVARSVVRCFPEVNELWLLTGSGDMFTQQDEWLRTPFYRLDLEQALPHLDELQPDERLCLPAVAAADVAVLYHGEAMSSRVPTGSIIFLKAESPDLIIPGGTYVLNCAGRLIFRTVRSLGEDKWRLTAASRSRYDDMDVAREEVIQAWRLCGHLVVDKF